MISAGEILSFSTEGWVAPKLPRRADKFMLYILSAGKKALADGGISKEVMNELDKTRPGVIINHPKGEDVYAGVPKDYVGRCVTGHNFYSVLLGNKTAKRGATIYDEFLGESFTSDAYHMTEPHPEGKGDVLCIEKALDGSGVSQVHDRSPIRSSWSCGSCCVGAVEAVAAGAFFLFSCHQVCLKFVPNFIQAL
ncbi:hypothetical protein C5167_021160 [Papaver somniferum]|uniref:beta-ketoacyl-[acyl-carrier-protein] synthase I n=1 Tax=Papaver somniferum TaxID=3469 RepID=A0A4Y7IV23_PAPSO|nr:hypothetical protein C5167_021160 [Papaver somniferum]